MSLPEWLLDEPDDDYCEQHPGYLRPCRVCKVEAYEMWAEIKMEQRRDDKLTGDL